MTGKIRRSAFRLGLSILSLISLLTVMVPAASASEKITCSFVPAPGGTSFAYEFVRQAAQNTFLTEHVSGAMANECFIGTFVLENRYTGYSDGDFHSRGWGTFEGRYWDGQGFTSPGTVTLRVRVDGSPIKDGIITVNETIINGTGGLADVHGQGTEVIDLRAGTDVATWIYNFDP